MSADRTPATEETLDDIANSLYRIEALLERLVTAVEKSVERREQEKPLDLSRANVPRSGGF